jgi:glucose-6-phosphate isomerase
MSQTLSLDSYAGAVAENVQAFVDQDAVNRFWAKDPTLWAPAPSAEVGAFLGWIDVIEKIQSRLPEITEFAFEIAQSGFTRVVLAGMGGSSLCPLVLSSVFKPAIPFHGMDSTHPDEIKRVQDGGDLATTLFIIASKSGSTAEPTAFDAYFFDLVGKPENFVAITDPGSPFHQSAEARGYRKIFLNYADIGGRYSALSLFGMVPAALMGIDVAKFLDRTALFAKRHHDGFGEAFQLGCALGTLANVGRDKLTILTDPKWSTYGLWLEQLIAESTGKHGKGILPVAGEALGAPEAYADDRVFAYIGGIHPHLTPNVHINLNDPYDLGADFLRWEIATAIAGAVIGINPFDQPNVQESKDITKAYLKRIDEDGQLPPWVLDHGLHEFTDDLEPGEYLSIQAYIPETPANAHRLAELQADFRNIYRVAVTSGFGPRFLHSTGQFHKGGPKTGRFLQIVDTPTWDAAIPGQTATWAQFVDAQARGDREALEAHGLKVFTTTLENLK